MHPMLCVYLLVFIYLLFVRGETDCLNKLNMEGKMGNLCIVLLCFFLVSNIYFFVV